MESRLTRSIGELVLIYWKLEGSSMMAALGSFGRCQSNGLDHTTTQRRFYAMRHKDHEAKLALT